MVEDKVRFDGDATPLLDAIEKCIQGLTTFDEAVKKSSDSAGVSATNFTTLKDSLKGMVPAGLTKQIKDLAAAFDRLSTAGNKKGLGGLSGMATAFQNLDLSAVTAKMAAFTGELSAQLPMLRVYNDELERLVVLLAALRRLGNQRLPNTGLGNQGSGGPLGTFGGILGSSLLYHAIYAVIGAFRTGVSTSIEFEQRVAEIQTISQDAAKSTYVWAQEIRKLSDEFGFSAKTVAEGTYQAISNQIVKGADAMVFMADAARFAQATVSSVDDAVNLLSGTLKAFQMDADRTEYVAATLFKTIELGRVRAADMKDSFGNIAILAGQLGISLEELEASIAALTVQGLKYDYAATQMRGMFSRLLKPTKEMKDFLKELGVASGQAAIETYGLTGMLEILRTRTQNSSAEMAKFFKDIRGLTGALGLSHSGFDEYNTALELIKDSLKTYNEAVRLTSENASKAFQRLGESLKNFMAIDVGMYFIDMSYAISQLVKSLSGGLFDGFDLVRVAVEALVVTIATGAIPALSAWALGVERIIAMRVGITGFVGLLGQSLVIIKAHMAATAGWRAGLVGLQGVLYVAKLSIIQLGVAIKGAWAAMMAWFATPVGWVVGLVALLTAVTAALGYLAYQWLYAKDIAERSAREYRETLSKEMRAANEEVEKHIQIIELSIKRVGQIYAQANAEQASALNLQVIEFSEKNKDIINVLKKSNEFILEDLTAKINKFNERGNKGAVKNLQQLKNDIEYAFTEITKTKIEDENKPTDLNIIELQSKAIKAEIESASEVANSVARIQLLLLKDQELTEQLGKSTVEWYKNMYNTRLELLQREMVNYKKVGATAAQRLNLETMISNTIKERDARVKLAEIQNQQAIQKQKQQAIQASLKAEKANLDEYQRMILKAKSTAATAASKLSYFYPGETHLKFVLSNYMNDLYLKGKPQNSINFVENIAKTLKPEQADLKKALDDFVKANKALGKETPTTLKTKVEETTKNIADLSSKIEDETFLLIQAADIQKKAADAQNVAADLQMKAAQANEFANKSIPERFASYLGQVKGWMGFARGGFVPGIGSRDSVPAMLTPGEFVVNKKAAGRFYGQLLAINSGRRMAGGGSVSNSVAVGDVNINMTSSGNVNYDVARLGNRLRREIQRGACSLK